MWGEDCTVICFQFRCPTHRRTSASSPILARQRNLNSIPIQRIQRKVTSDARRLKSRRELRSFKKSSRQFPRFPWNRRTYSGDSGHSIGHRIAQMTRSFPPSTGICAPVVLAKTGPATAQARAATSEEVISTPSKLLDLYWSTLIP